MRRTLKVLSALLSYPTAELQAAIPALRIALDQEACLPQKNRDRLDRIMEELAVGDLYELQERYVLLFDRSRSLSLHMFEHVHGESRDRGQAMVDLKALYERHGLRMTANELPDHLPLFFEFLSQIPGSEARELLDETSHILELIRLRLKKRKVPYSSIFSCAQILSQGSRQAEIAAALINASDDNPNDLAALDAAWEEVEVTFGPAAAPQCGKDGLTAKLRAALRPAPDMPATAPQRPIITCSPSNRA
jgi:nitrate reductase delta subunit